MSLINLIEKLINEHGSFKEHLELLREQIAILEKENSALKSENAILKGKEDTKEFELNTATKEIERLNEVIKVPKKDGEKPRFDAVAEKVLKLLFDKGREMSVNEVAANLSINISIARYHFDLLSEAKLIVQTTTDDKSSWTDKSTPALFELSYLGRKYVIENKIMA